jgi:hypothetical protein
LKSASAAAGVGAARAAAATAAGEVGGAMETEVAASHEGSREVFCVEYGGSERTGHS